MSVLRRQIRCPIDPDADPSESAIRERDAGLERLQQYLVTNGYECAGSLEALEIDELDDDLEVHLGDAPAEAIFAAHRGEPGAGWWHSDQSKLQSVILVRDLESEFLVKWFVDTSGQHMTDDDEAFWDRESDHARRAIFNELDELPDLRNREKRRSKRTTRRSIRFGIAVGFFIFCAVIFLAMLGII